MTSLRDRPNIALLVVDVQNAVVANAHSQPGAQTDACIPATILGAFTRGYDTILVSDAHTTEDFSRYGLPPADKVIAHTNMYWSWQVGSGRNASVVEIAGVNFDASEHDISS